jgi:CheY-like chemotaxis protein
MDGQSKRDRLRELEKISTPEAEQEVINALYDPATCCLAINILVDHPSPSSNEAIVKLLVNENRTEDQALGLIDGNARKLLTHDKMLRWYYRDYDELPLHTLLVIAHAATDTEYAQFQAWRAEQAVPLYTVLTIDDDSGGPALMRIMTNFSEHFIMIGIAPNARVGADYIQRFQPDIIILDHMMPGLSGVEAVKFIRPLAPKSALVFRTYLVSINDQLVADSLAAGADDVINYGPVLFQDYREALIRFAGHLKNK